MTNVQKIHDLIGKMEKILDKLDDAESNLSSFNDDLHSILKSTSKSNKWLKGEIKSGLTWVEDWQENVGLFKKAFNQFKDYLEGILDELVDWTSADLISELNKILKRYRYIKRWVVLIAEYEEMKREEIEAEDSSSVKQLDALCDEADQIYDDFYDDSDDFWDKDEEEENDDNQDAEEAEEETEEEPDDEIDEAQVREVNQHKQYIQELRQDTADLKKRVVSHYQWVVDQNNSIVDWADRYSRNFSEWLTTEVEHFLGWCDSFLKQMDNFIKLFDDIESQCASWLPNLQPNQIQSIRTDMTSSYRRFGYIKNWINLTEEYINTIFVEFDENTDAYVPRLKEICNAINELEDNYNNNDDDYWKRND